MQVAEAVHRVLAVSTIARIWVFPPLRGDGREWGTAVIATGDRARVRVHTARYMMPTRGKQRGRARVEIATVGEGPADTVDEVVRGVQERTGEPDPPVAIDPAVWYGVEDDESPTEG